MGLLNKYKKFQKLRFGAGLLAVGLLIAVIAGVFLFRPEGNTEKVSAVITDIQTEGAGDDTTYHVTVEYTVNGRTYHSELGEYQSNWNVGDTIECKYNVDDPSEVVSGSKLMVIIILAVGAVAAVFGAFTLLTTLKTPSEDFGQYDRVKPTQIDHAKAEELRRSNEPQEDFVFHFTGKLNQSYVMKDAHGKPLLEALCEGISLAKATKFTFNNHLTGASQVRMVGHTVSHTYGEFSVIASSAFDIDGQSCWDVLASKGYSLSFRLNGVKPHYEVKHMGVNVGWAEMAGTGAMNPKYADNPLGKVPTNGIYRVHCPRSEAEGLFLVCFCLSRTSATVS